MGSNRSWHHLLPRNQRRIFLPEYVPVWKTSTFVVVESFARVICYARRTPSLREGLKNSSLAVNAAAQFFFPLPPFGGWEQ
jgi:hypothetical protein